MRRSAITLASGIMLGWTATAGVAEAAPGASPISALADRWVALKIAHDPTIAEAVGLPSPDTARLADRSPAALARLRAGEDALWGELRKIKPATLRQPGDRVLYEVLTEAVGSERQLRVCRLELWNGIDHFGGWQAALPVVAREQPVGTPAARAAALKRWAGLPAFVDVEIGNLRSGLKAGYSVPKPVVQRVIRQLDGLLSTPPTESPFHMPATRDTDAAFKTAFGALVADRINPAIRRYRDFLKDEYLPRARDSLGLAALPQGRACYAAFLRKHTTLDRSPQKVFALGQETVSRNETEVADLGRRMLQASDFAETVRKAGEADSNRFRSAEELLAYSRDGLVRTEERTRPLFANWPSQRVVIEPVPEYQRGSGTTASYRPNPDPRQPSIFFLPLEPWRSNTRGNAEVTVAHEAWPGHHLQAATAGLISPSPLMKIADNAAYIEGWARYAERIAEEAGAYETVFAPITRRVWAARGMVIDPGIHLYGWTREQAKAYAMASGRFDERAADALVDRVAAVPAQLTAYDSGGLEILGLRREAEAALGECFDIRQFHARILEQGSVPLNALRRHVEAWVAAEKRRAPERCSRVSDQITLGGERK